MSSFALPDLQYDYDALEPVIGTEIMQLHHSKHHQAYVTNLNVALEKHADAEAKGDVSGMIAAQSAINFTGGGHINHSIFWENLAPQGSGGGGAPTGALGAAIDAKWGSFDAFKTEFNATTAAVQVRGGWLVHDADTSHGFLSSRAPIGPRRWQPYAFLIDVGARLLSHLQKRPP